MRRWEGKGRRGLRELRWEMWKAYGFRNACLLCGTGCESLLTTRVPLGESRDHDDAEWAIAVRCIDFHSTAYAVWDVFYGC